MGHAVLGLRPEHFSLGEANGSRPADVFNLPVRYSEKTGSDATAFLAVGDQLISVRIDPAMIKAVGTGNPVKVSFPRDKLNVFDARSGRRM